VTEEGCDRVWVRACLEKGDPCPRPLKSENRQNRVSVFVGKDNIGRGYGITIHRLRKAGEA
jgi:hypothetical protein